jgi:hypothetical protein
MDLSPFVIVALGQPARPVERLIGLQAAIGRFIAWVAGLRLVRIPDQTATRTARILAKS